MILLQDNTDQMPSGLLLVGNKVDLDDQGEREVSVETGETFAKVSLDCFTLWCVGQFPGCRPLDLVHEPLPAISLCSTLIWRVI